MTLIRPGAIVAITHLTGGRQALGVELKANPSIDAPSEADPQNPSWISKTL